MDWGTLGPHVHILASWELSFHRKHLSELDREVVSDQEYAVVARLSRHVGV